MTEPQNDVIESGIEKESEVNGIFATLADECVFYGGYVKETAGAYVDIILDESLVEQLKSVAKGVDIRLSIGGITLFEGKL